MTNSEMAIITLLAEKPRHGYELEQVIEERGMREWTDIGFSSIYHILNKLEKNGWVSVKREESATRGPGKKVYTLTPAGTAIWLDSSLEMLKHPAKSNSSLDLGLANLPGLPQRDVIDALTERRSVVMQIIKHVSDRSQTDGNQVLHVQIMFDHSLSLLQAELDWLDRTIARLVQSLSK
jgi:DNA-binding PadR family transcriptional regulator